MMICPRLIAAAAAVLSLAAGGAVLAQGAGGYTAAQADKGLTTFKTTCSLCHGENLGGGPGTPSLIGPEFMFGWKGKTAAELYDYVKTKMPPGSAGGLSDQQYADVTAAILKANDQPAGPKELTPDPAALAMVKITAP